ncbi:MAG: class I SAM-dependent methyltransferase [Planctomycetaceae bacterium]
MAVTVGQRSEKAAVEKNRAIPPSSTERQDQRLPNITPESLAQSSGWVARRFNRLMGKLGNPPVSLISWKGESLYDAGPKAVGKVRFLERSSLWPLLINPQLHFAEGYCDGKIVVEGDLKQILLALFQSAPNGHATRTRSWFSWLTDRRRNTLKRSQDNIHHHYDLGNDFYRLWLDQQLLYTCAYFPDPSVSLEEAQIAKMNRVCRKLWLKPGEHVVEAGCGWGALALHMAQHFGVKVTAYNISKEQIHWARERVREERLDHLVTYIQDDWRNISGSCDAFVSVGMLEHVGKENYIELGRVIERCLSPHGRGLIHSIGRNRPAPLDTWTERYIFPGAYTPAISEMTDILENSPFSLLDVENLRRHYTLTLDHWLRRFEQNAEKIRTMFDERFVRMWRMYLAASSATFEAGNLQLFQLVFAPGRSNHIPWTRDGLLTIDSDETNAGRDPLFVPSPIPSGE